MCVATGSHAADAMLGALTVGTFTAGQAASGKMHAQKKKDNPLAVPTEGEAKPFVPAKALGRKIGADTYTNAPDPSVGLQIQ